MSVKTVTNKSDSWRHWPSLKDIEGRTVGLHPGESAQVEVGDPVKDEEGSEVAADFGPYLEISDAEAPRSEGPPPQVQTAAVLPPVVSTPTPSGPPADDDPEE